MLGNRDGFSIRYRAGRQIGTVRRLPGGGHAVRDNAGRTTGTVTRRR